MLRLLSLPALLILLNCFTLYAFSTQVQRSNVFLAGWPPVTTFLIKLMQYSGSYREKINSTTFVNGH